MSDVAYELDEGAVRGGPIVFAGVPGVWHVGVPQAVFDLGHDEDSFDDLLEERGLTDKFTKTTATPVRAEGQRVGGADVKIAPPVAPELVAAAQAPADELAAKTRNELNQVAAAAGLNPDDYGNKSDLVAAIEAAAESTGGEG